MATQFSAENARISVIVRARPPADGSNPDDAMSIFPDQQGLINIRGADADGEPVEREFLLDDVLTPSTSQKELFDKHCTSQIDHVLEGFNSCIFAYGQTGSGKTYTIFGEDGEKDMGIVPRSVEYAFAQMAKRPQKKYTCFVSYLEVYMDKLRDLGTLPTRGEEDVEYKGAPKSTGSRPNTAGSRRSVTSAMSGDGSPEDLEIRENPNGSVYVKDLSSISVSTVSEVMAVVNAGNAKRQTYQTLMNEHSSRSHTVVTLTIVADGKGGETAVTGRLNIVDLAGCERLKRSGAGDSESGVADNGMRAKEAVIINKSLSTLGSVVMALAKKDSSYVPFRDSKLTRLLQDSLRGSSYTTLIATIHPRPVDSEETLSTVQFANRCRNVVTHPQVNYLDDDAASQQKIIEKLMSEVAELKDQLKSQKSYYEGRLLAGGAGGHGSMDEGTFESSAEGGEGGGGGGASRGGSRGSRGVTPSKRGPGTPGEAQRKHLEATQAAALANAESRHQEMKDKFNKKNNEFRAAQEAARVNEERLKKDIDELRGKVSRLHEELAGNNQTWKMAKMDEAERYERELELVRDHNNKLLNDMDAALRNVPDKLKVDSGTLKSAEQNAMRLVEAKDKEMSLALKNMAAEKDKALSLQKEQYEYWLNKKSDEMKAYIADFEAYKVAKTSQLNEVEKHSLYLFEYSNALATIIMNFEKGLYPVYEKSGVKAAAIPDKAKPGPMSAEVLRDLSKYKKRAEDFIKAHPTASTTSGIGRVASTVASTTLPQPGELSAQQVNELRAELETYKERIAEAEATATSKSGEERHKIEQDVLNDLADHPTVEYIKRIEDERAYYKDQLSEEVRRCKDLRVALDSKQRQLEKHLAGTSTLGHSMNRSGASSVNRSASRQR